MRLIDADALTASLKESADRCRDWIQECINIKDDVTQRVAEQSLLTFNECYLRIKKMPTIEPQRWIPVTERTPEPDERVAVTTGGYEYHVWDCMSNRGDDYFWEDEEGYYHNKYAVDAWMPLPEPY